MKLLLVILLLSIQAGAWAQVLRKDPGNWVFESNFRTEKTRLMVNGKNEVWDSTGYIIRCDTSRKIIYFIQDDNDTMAIPYRFIDTYDDDPYIYKRGVFYYKTLDLGDVEWWPGNLVRRNWPGQIDIKYSKQVKQRR